MAAAAAAAAASQYTLAKDLHTHTHTAHTCTHAEFMRAWALQRTTLSPIKEDTGGDRGGELINSPNTPPAEGEEEDTKASNKDEAEVRVMSPVPPFFCVFLCSNGSIVGKGTCDFARVILLNWADEWCVCVCVCVHVLRPPIVLSTLYDVLYFECTGGEGSTSTNASSEENRRQYT